MRVAVVGTGIAGLCAARALCRSHELVVFEAAERLGGHTHTVDVDDGGRALAVDTGFIVFNEATYPGLCRLFRELGVRWRPSDMSFSVRVEASGLEYEGGSLGGLLARRTNALRPSFWRMVRDILRFYREAPEVLAWPEDDATTLGDYLARGRYSRAFVEDHLLPMGSAVWSATAETMRAFPLRFLVRFFHNHGFLRVDGRPSWLVVEGGSRAYLEPLCRPFAHAIRLATPVTGVRRVPEGVLVRTASGPPERFDRVVLATHADQSLRLLGRGATPRERALCAAVPYQRNVALLHTDARVMPRRRRAWASWNVHVADPPSGLPTVTYWMNRLQGLDARQDWFVTLNRENAIDPSKVHRRLVVQHPIFGPDGLRTRERLRARDGEGGVFLCGAWQGFGFHEDGLQSGLAAAARLERTAAAGAPTVAPAATVEEPSA